MSFSLELTPIFHPCGPFGETTVWIRGHRLSSYPDRGENLFFSLVCNNFKGLDHPYRTLPTSGFQNDEQFLAEVLRERDRFLMTSTELLDFHTVLAVYDDPNLVFVWKRAADEAAPYYIDSVPLRTLSNVIAAAESFIAELRRGRSCIY
ncbi:MAG: hypothetical protein JSR82_09550 [Verrucomicrobia bacterium]|nr:hypothetical protein [Verrucomicrobiota bacterium]